VHVTSFLTLKKSPFEKNLRAIDSFCRARNFSPKIKCVPRRAPSQRRSASSVLPGQGRGESREKQETREPSAKSHLTFTSLRFCQRPRVTASLKTRVKDGTKLKDCSEPPALRSSRTQPKNKKRGGEKVALTRKEELPIHPPQVSTQGGPKSV
jgi:hypothetical protein